MINLSLNFKYETRFPDNLDEFSKILNTNEFQQGFKIIGSNIIPLTGYNNENIKNNAIAPIYNDLGKLYNKLQDTHNQKSFYVLKKENSYTLHIDEDINKGIINIEVEKNGLNIIKKVFGLIFGESITDPYMEHLIKDHLEIKLGFKDRVATILSIINKKETLVVSFDKYMEANGGDPKNLDHYKYGGAYHTVKEVIKKEDLT